MQRIVVELTAAALVTGCSGDPRSEAGPPDLTQQSSTVELDHVFVFAPIDSPEAKVVEALQQVGLIVDEQRNEFPEGVIGRYVFFDNAYLELLWLEPNATTEADTRKMADWENSGASPFGIGLHRRSDAPEQLPFPSRSQIEEWMPPGTEMRVLTEEDETLAPGLFVVPPIMAAPDFRNELGEAAAEKLDHPLGARRITGVRMVTLPEGYPNRTDAFAGTGIQFERGDQPLIEIKLDEGQYGKSKDLRPVLPLTLSY